MPTVKRKIYLTFPPAKVKEAIICEMYDRYKVRFNIRSATVTDAAGLIALELEGEDSAIQEAIAYFGKRGLTVEPIELDVLST